MAFTILSRRPNRPLRRSSNAQTIESSCGTSAAALCAVAFDVVPSIADEQIAKAPVELADAQRVAPNFVGIDNWLNSAPLNIADLRGKVVLIDFWTYGC